MHFPLLPNKNLYYNLHQRVDRLNDSQIHTPLNVVKTPFGLIIKSDSKFPDYNIRCYTPVR